MRKILSFFLVMLIFDNILSANIFATELSTYNDNSEISSEVTQMPNIFNIIIPVKLHQDATIFSVTVPTVLPVVVDSYGTITVATNNKIINNSWGPIEVKEVYLIPVNGWKIVNFDTSFYNKKIDLKEFSFSLNDIPVMTDGSCEVVFPYVLGSSFITFEYDANIAIQQIAIEDEQIAYVVFTIGWFDLEN